MPYSYSRLKTYVVCPRQYQAKYVDFSVKFVGTPATERGERIHKRLEDAVLAGDTEVEGVWTPPGLLSLLARARAQVEAAYAIRGDGTPCGWDDPDCFLRGRIDVDMAGLMIDWKTGQVRPDPLQADVYAMLKRTTLGIPDYPVDFHFVYVDHKVTIQERPDEHATDRVLSVIKTIEANRQFHPHPCFACKWCPVSTCEYVGGR